MTKDQFLAKYTYGLDGDESVKFTKFVAILEDLLTRGCGGEETLNGANPELAVIGTGTGFVILIGNETSDSVAHLPAVADLKVGHTIRGFSLGDVKLGVHPLDMGQVALNEDTTSDHYATILAGTFTATLGAIPIPGGGVQTKLKEKGKAKFRAPGPGSTIYIWVLSVVAIDGTVTAPVIAGLD